MVSDLSVIYNSIVHYKKKEKQTYNWVTDKKERSKDQLESLSNQESNYTQKRVLPKSNCMFLAHNTLNRRSLHLYKCKDTKKISSQNRINPIIQ